MESIGLLDPYERRRIVRIAERQRHVTYVALAYLLYGGLAIVDPAIGRAIMGFVALGIVIAGVICVHRLASELYSMAAAIFCDVTLFIPLVGLITLLVLSGRATRELRRFRLRVGLLGVDEAQLGKLRA
jgi:hypothetical protein